MTHSPPQDSCKPLHRVGQAFEILTKYYHASCLKSCVSLPGRASPSRTEDTVGQHMGGGGKMRVRGNRAILPPMDTGSHVPELVGNQLYDLGLLAREQQPPPFSPIPLLLGPFPVSSRRLTMICLRKHNVSYCHLPVLFSSA